MDRGFLRHLQTFHDRIRRRKSLALVPKKPKWSHLSRGLSTGEDLEKVDDTTGISRATFENHFQESAPFIGTLLFQYFQHNARPGDHHRNPNMISERAFVKNVMEILALHSSYDQIYFYFKVFSKGSGTLHEDEMLLLLTVSVKVACYATGLSRLISDADQQVFHALVRSLDVDSDEGVDAIQFGEWVEKNGVHLLNCLHHLVVQTLISCSGAPSHESKSDTNLEEDSLPILDQDNDKLLQLNSMALLWLLSCALPRLYIKRSSLAASCGGFPSVQSSSDFESLSSGRGYVSRMHPSPSCPTMNPHQFIQQLVDAANLTTWTLLYNSDKHGMAMNRFLHHILHYNGPTVSIYRLESGSAYCIAVDTEWHESQHRFGGADCVVYQLQPQFKKLECGANMVYFNVTNARGSYRGIEIGGDPEHPILKVEADMQSAVTGHGVPDTIVCVEWKSGQQLVWTSDKISVSVVLGFVVHRCKYYHYVTFTYLLAEILAGFVWKVVDSWLDEFLPNADGSFYTPHRFICHTGSIVEKWM